MNFAGVKAITIPEGDVRSIAIGGVTVWQKPNPLPYDAEVEYVEPDAAGAYVDTLLPVTVGTRVDASWRQMSQTPLQQRLFGVNDGGNAQFALYVNGNARWAFNAGAATAPAIYSVPAPYDYVGTFDLATGAWSIEAVGYSAGSASGTASGTPFASANTIPIFARRNAGTVYYADYPAQMRLYSFKIYDGQTLVRDFIPVRVGTAGYLYDRANPTGGPLGNGLYGSATSTPLVAGPDKNGA